MGLFDGPPVTDAQRELVAMTDARTKEWYLEAEIAMLNMRISELESALELAHKLYNSVNGSLDAFEHDLRMDMGNTNYNCIKERLHEFEAARKALGEEE